MPLRKSPTISSRLLDANRANAQYSTGRKTAQGKARSRLKALWVSVSEEYGRLRGEERKKTAKNRTSEARMSFKIKGPQKRTHQVTENKEFNSDLRGKHISIMSLGQILAILRGSKSTQKGRFLAILSHFAPLLAEGHQVYDSKSVGFEVRARCHLLWSSATQSAVSGATGDVH